MSRNGSSINLLGIAMSYDDEVATLVLFLAWLCRVMMEMVILGIIL